MTELERINGPSVSRPIGQSPVRTSVRFPIRLALTLHTEEGSFEAFTENVSANGLLFVCDYLPPVNSRIEFTMAMPAAVMGANQDVVIHCIGRIVRHQIDGTVKKAGVVIDEYFLKA